MTTHADLRTRRARPRSAGRANPMTTWLLVLGIILSAWTIWTAAAMALLERGWGADMPEWAFIVMAAASVLSLFGAYWWWRKEAER